MLAAFGGMNLQEFEFALSPPHHQMAQDTLKLIASKPHFQSFTGRPLDDLYVQNQVLAWVKDYDAIRKPVQYDEVNQKYKERWKIVLRCQWKYFQKYARALEQNQHGFLSALLLQRKLLFFREGEFALEEDYPFALEEARQFLLRREILRAVASHTCSDIYFLSPVSAEALLFFCDEIQDWGRPRFEDIYSAEMHKTTPDVTLVSYTPKRVGWRLRASFPTDKDFCTFVLRIAHALYSRLRSAPDSKGRRFSVDWKCLPTAGSKVKHRARFTSGEGDQEHSFEVTLAGKRKPQSFMPLIDALLTGKQNMEQCKQSLLEAIKGRKP